MTATTATWQARGFTDDVTECQQCGKPELKGTVRMVVVGPDGDNEGEIYAGVVCAARLAGRKAADIRTEAARADRARDEAVREAYRAWSDAHSRWFCARRDAHLGGGPGRHIPYADIKAWQEAPEHQAAEAAWLTDNPRPLAPWEK